jgi:hypothetical protein
MQKMGLHHLRPHRPWATVKTIFNFQPEICLCTNGLWNGWWWIVMMPASAFLLRWWILYYQDSGDIILSHAVQCGKSRRKEHADCALVCYMLRVWSPRVAYFIRHVEHFSSQRKADVMICKYVRTQQQLAQKTPFCVLYKCTWEYHMPPRLNCEARFVCNSVTHSRWLRCFSMLNSWRAVHECMLCMYALRIKTVYVLYLCYVSAHHVEVLMLHVTLQGTKLASAKCVSMSNTEVQP